MPVKMRVRLDGDERFRRAVGSLALPKAEPIYRRALTRNGERVRETTRREFLSGQLLRVRTGELRRSIDLNPFGLPRYIEIGSALPQAGPLHFGWPRRNMPARPFLERGLDRSLPHLPPPWAEEMDRSVRRRR